MIILRILVGVYDSKKCKIVSNKDPGFRKALGV